MLLALIAVAQTGAAIPLALPRPATSQIVVKTRCLSNDFVIGINNDGFSSKLEMATVNNKPVAFRSVTDDLAQRLGQMHSVSVQVTQCTADGDVMIFLSGVDTNRASPDFGKEVLLPFQSRTQQRR